MLPKQAGIECITKLMVSIVALRNVIINRFISSLIMDIDYNIFRMKRVYVVLRIFIEESYKLPFISYLWPKHLQEMWHECAHYFTVILLIKSEIIVKEYVCS